MSAAWWEELVSGKGVQPLRMNTNFNFEEIVKKEDIPRLNN